MTTVINPPGNAESSNSAITLIIGLIALVIVAALFFVYVLPEIRNPGAPKDGSIDVNIKLPADNSAPQQ